jgi:hypothetical protein
LLPLLEALPRKSGRILAPFSAGLLYIKTQEDIIMISLINAIRNKFTAKETIVEEYYGKSTDVKPVLDASRNGSIFYEMDTQDAYMFDGDTLSWILQ